MTVREAFAICYPGVPEDASIHVGAYGFLGPEFGTAPSYQRTSEDGTFAYHYYKGIWNGAHDPDACSVGPEISNRPASAFLGFFGKEYDKVVEANT